MPHNRVHTLPQHSGDGGPAAAGGPSVSTRLSAKPRSRLSSVALLALVGFGSAYALTRLGRSVVPGDAPPGMAWVPGGEFSMGTDAAVGWAEERPAHRVRVGGLSTDATDVTHAQFRRVVAA